MGEKTCIVWSISKRRQPERSAPKFAPQKTKAKAIEQALDTPHAAPACVRIGARRYDAIGEIRARTGMPTPVDTMGCDTVKKETDPLVQ